MTTEDETLASVITRLTARAENAYSDYISQSRKDECLGWEIKVERGMFGTAELQAHSRRGELLGRHRALMDAVELLTALKDLPNV